MTTLHIIAELFLLNVLVGGCILLYGMLKQDWHKIVRAFWCRPMDKD